MVTFDTLPTEIRLEIYRHVFGGLQLRYIPYVPLRCRHWKPDTERREPDVEELKQRGPCPDVSILFVSRKTLYEARPILLDSLVVDIELIAAYGWRTYPGNTNFKIGDHLRHVYIDISADRLWYTCPWYFERTFTISSIRKCFQHLPFLRSVSYQLDDAGMVPQVTVPPNQVDDPLEKFWKSLWTVDYARHSSVTKANGDSSPHHCVPSVNESHRLSLSRFN